MLVLIIIFLAGVYISLSLFLFFSQYRLLYYPDYPSRTITLTPENLNLNYEPISFETSNGLTLFDWFIPRAHSLGTVIVFHGNAGNISHQLELIQLFYRLGLNTFIFDYRGYGRVKEDPQSTAHISMQRRHGCTSCIADTSHPRK